MNSSNYRKCFANQTSHLIHQLKKAWKNQNRINLQAKANCTKKMILFKRKYSLSPEVRLQTHYPLKFKSGHFMLRGI